MIIKHDDDNKFWWHTIQPDGDGTVYEDKRPIIKTIHDNKKSFPFDQSTDTEIATAATEGITQQSEGSEKHEGDPEHVVIDYHHVPDLKRKKREAFRERLSEKANRKIKLEKLKKTATEDIKTVLCDAIAEGAAEARRLGFVEHTDHHTLSPGMLLLDQVFKGLSGFVQRTVREYNDEPIRTKRSLEELLRRLDGFINLLNGVGIPDLTDETCEEAVKYRSFIAAKIDHPEVDSTRILLRWSSDPEKQPAPKVRGAKLIVGAWKGGTHSSDHPL